MKGTFSTLSEFAAEVERMEQESRDVIAPAERITVIDDTGRLSMEEAGGGPLNNHAEGQLIAKLGIPRGYWDSIKEVRDLRRKNAQELLNYRGSKGDKMLVRMLDGTVRAVLSDAYRPINNAQILRALFPAIQEASKDRAVKIVSEALSETRMYLQVVFPQIQGEVRRGDIIQAGTQIENSEVGASKFIIRRLYWRLECENGLTSHHIISERHVGQRLGNGVNEPVAWKQDTLEAEVIAYNKMIRDVFSNALDQSTFERELMRMREVEGIEVRDINATVERVIEAVDLRKEDHSKIVTGVARNGLTAWGVINSITGMAHEFEDADRQAEYENAGGKLLDMSPAKLAQLVA